MEDWTSLGQHKRHPEFPVVTRESRCNSRKSTGANFENLTLVAGSAALNGTGNALNNAITGNSGNNVLDGAGGNDTLGGGLGDDTYVVDSAADRVLEALNGGSDLVRSSVSYVLPLNVERLELTGAGDINGTGNALANTLTGNSGNNRLDGGAGADQMIGGPGDDTYVLDRADDIVTELAGEGVDTIILARSVNLLNEFPNIENVTLSGVGLFTITGDDEANRLIGNAAANVLTGAGGNDILDGKGGADQMSGGLGDDQYFVDRLGDGILENAGEGTDTVYTPISFSVEQLAYVENVTLIGAGALFITGNQRDNHLVGNSGETLLEGNQGNDTLEGGAGTDALYGGEGNDNLSGGEGDDLLHGGTEN